MATCTPVQEQVLFLLEFLAPGRSADRRMFSGEVGDISMEMLLPLKSSTVCRAVVVKACQLSSVSHQARVCEEAPPWAEVKPSATGSSRRLCLLNAVN